MDSSPGMDMTSHRACAHCRSQKVRCIPDDSNPDVCQRCARSGRPCVFTPLQKRKQRKRTDTRVAELEREMRAMRSMLKKNPGGGAEGTGDTEHEAPDGEPVGLWFERNVQGALISAPAVTWDPSREVNGTQQVTPQSASSTEDGGARQLYRTPFRNGPCPDARDVVDMGLLSMATARRLLGTYKDLYCHYPMVAIPEGITADQMRATKPTLFLAIIAAAACKEDSDLSATLDQEVLYSYATRSLVNSEKNLELVQALLISAAWYHPPQKFGQLKYYEYIHMAATMAMDIGIGTRSTPRRPRFGSAAKLSTPPASSFGHPAEDAANPDLSMTPRVPLEDFDTASIESRRTFLGCFTMCAGISLSLRRPNMLRNSSYINDCVDVFERSPQTLPSDRILVAWVKLVIIAEEICNAFCYDDPEDVASLAELRTQLMLKDFQKRLSSWWLSVPEVDLSGALTIMYYTIRLYLNEVALHIEHHLDDFKAPYQMGTLQNYDGREIPTQILASTIAECITCSHAMCNTFLSMSVESLRCLPVFSYVRISFATFILAKLCLSAAHPNTRIAQVLDISSLKVESYMDRMILHVRNIVGPTRRRVPAIFLALLFKLRHWCLNPEMIAHGGRDVANARDGREMSEDSQPSTRDKLDVSGTVKESSTEIPPDMSAGLPSASAGSIQSSLDSGSKPAVDSYSSRIPNSGSIPSSSSSGIDTGGQYQGSVDQMELDKDFVELWNQMNGLPKGGLTGLEDWSQLSTDMMGFTSMSDMSSWPMLTGMDNMPNGGS